MMLTAMETSVLVTDESTVHERDELGHKWRDILYLNSFSVDGPDVTDIMRES